jgi:hypothetical protein
MSLLFSLILVDSLPPPPAYTGYFTLICIFTMLELGSQCFLAKFHDGPGESLKDHSQSGSRILGFHEAIET